jgi:cell pole-organizing protein PopZ
MLMHDDIYSDINKSEKDAFKAMQVDAEAKPARTLEDMAKEADLLRPLFQQYDDIWKSSL